MAVRDGLQGPGLWVIWLKGLMRAQVMVVWIRDKCEDASIPSEFIFQEPDLDGN